MINIWIRMTTSRPNHILQREKNGISWSAIKQLSLNLMIFIFISMSSAIFFIPNLAVSGIIENGDDEGATHCHHDEIPLMLIPVKTVSQIKNLSTKTFVTTPLLPEYEGEDKGTSKFWNALIEPKNKADRSEWSEKNREDEGEKREKKIVKYLSPAEQQKFLVSFKDGKFLNSSGNPITTGRKGSLYIMDSSGRFFIRPSEDLRDLYHSSLSRGRPLAAAGIMLIEDGILTYIDDGSGHYQPKRLFILQAIERLKEVNVVGNFTIKYFSAEKD